jgi:hypothetical protein
MQREYERVRLPTSHDRWQQRRAARDPFADESRARALRIAQWETDAVVRFVGRHPEFANDATKIDQFRCHFRANIEAQEAVNDGEARRLSMEMRTQNLIRAISSEQIDNSIEVAMMEASGKPSHHAHIAGAGQVLGDPLEIERRKKAITDAEAAKHPDNRMSPDALGKTLNGVARNVHMEAAQRSDADFKRRLRELGINTDTPADVSLPTPNTHRQ